MKNQYKLDDPVQLKQVLLFLYYYQTQDERVTQFTHESNGVGFNKVDAEILSSFAQQVLRGQELSEKQYLSAKLRLPKYHRQYEGADLSVISVPPVTYSNGKGRVPREELAKPKYTGMLELDMERKGGLKFTPNVYPSKQIKDLGFTHWDGKSWHQANGFVSLTLIADLKKMFGDIYIDPRVHEAAKVQSVAIPTETLVAAGLKDVQVRAVEFALTFKRVLLALKPRFGKSVVSIKAANLAGCQRILIVAPLSLMYNWRSKIKQWGDPDEPQAVVWYKKNLPISGKWTITNYDTLRLHPQQFHGIKWDLVIVDESLLIKNRKTKRTEVVDELIRNTQPEYVWLLSGAPKSRMNSDLWSQFHLLNPRRFSSYWRWVDRYCVIEQNQWSKYNIVADKPGSEEAIKQDHRDLYFYAEDGAVNITEPVFDDIPVQMSEDQDRMYSQLLEKFLAELPDGESLMAPNTLALTTRLIQVASNPLLVGGKDSSPKWDAAIEMLEFEELPAIIWTTFIETVSSLVERLEQKGYKVAKLTGATKPEKRQDVVDSFWDGTTQVIVAHPAVGKYGLDLGVAKTAIYAERHWFPDDYIQSLARIKVIDGKHQPHVIHLLSERRNGEETIDHIVHRLLEGRTDSVLKITSGDLKQMFWKENR